MVSIPHRSRCRDVPGGICPTPKPVWGCARGDLSQARTARVWRSSHRIAKPVRGSPGLARQRCWGAQAFATPKQPQTLFGLRISALKGRSGAHSPGPSLAQPAAPQGWAPQAEAGTATRRGLGLWGGASPASPHGTQTNTGMQPSTHPQSYFELTIWTLISHY